MPSVEAIRAAVERHGGSKTAAGAELGISRHKILRLIGAEQAETAASMCSGADGRTVTGRGRRDVTTIAFDGKSLCTDSRTTCDNIIVGSAMSKIGHLDDGRVFAMCGAIDINPMVAKWLNGGKKPRLEDDDQFQGIVVNPDTGEVLEFNESLRMYPTNVPWAGGSGRIAALAAFAMGYDARGAVEVACKVDICSGLPVHEVKITTYRDQPPRSRKDGKRRHL